MDLAPLIPVVAIIAYAAVKIATMWSVRPGSASADVLSRVENLERTLQGLEQDLAETQERLDFAERVLGQAREERRIGD
jgi:hypothetical protein